VIQETSSPVSSPKGEKLVDSTRMDYDRRMKREVERGMIERCRHGEEAAWDELFSIHYGPTSRFVFQLSGDFTIDDSEEICQEAFLSVVKHLGDFNGRSALQTWIFRIAANKARDYRSKQTAAKRGSGVVPLSLQAEDDEGNRLLDPASTLPSPDDEMLRDEKWKLLGEALEHLGGPCQEILELRYFGELQYGEISKTLKLNEKTVSSRLSKCRDKLEIVLRRIFSRENLGIMPSKK